MFHLLFFWDINTKVTPNQLPNRHRRQNLVYHQTYVVTWKLNLWGKNFTKKGFQPKFRGDNIVGWYLPTNLDHRLVHSKGDLASHLLDVRDVRDLAKHLPR